MNQTAAPIRIHRDRAEIATITGHSFGDVRSIFDAHYLHCDSALADRAIATWATQ